MFVQVDIPALERFHEALGFGIIVGIITPAYRALQVNLGNNVLDSVRKRKCSSTLISKSDTGYTPADLHDAAILNPQVAATTRYRGHGR